MLNPQIELKNMLLFNAIQAFKETLIIISIQFHAISMTKLFVESVKIINSNLYQHGPSKFDNTEQLDEDTVAIIENGVSLPCFYHLSLRKL